MLASYPMKFEVLLAEFFNFCRVIKISKKFFFIEVILSKGISRVSYTSLSSWIFRRKWSEAVELKWVWTVHNERSILTVNR